MICLHLHCPWCRCMCRYALSPQPQTGASRQPQTEIEQAVTTCCFLRPFNTYGMIFWPFRLYCVERKSWFETNEIFHHKHGLIFGTISLHTHQPFLNATQLIFKLLLRLIFRDMHSPFLDRVAKCPFLHRAKPRNNFFSTQKLRKNVTFQEKVLVILSD